MPHHPQQHLTDEQFADFVLEQLAADEAGAIDAHLAVCVSCTERLNSYYEAEAAFPASEFAAARESLTAQMIDRLGLRPRPGIAILRGILERLDAFHVAMLAEPVLHHAAAGLPLLQMSADGRYAVAIDEAADRALVMTVSTLDVALDGCTVSASAGDWQVSDTMRASRGKVAVTLTMPASVRVRLQPSDQLRLHI